MQNVAANLTCETWRGKKGGQVWRAQKLGRTVFILGPNTFSDMERGKTWGCRGKHSLVQRTSHLDKVLPGLGQSKLLTSNSKC